MPVPPGERLVEVVLVALGDVEERRGARAAVEVLVAAADREVRAVRVEAHVKDAGGVAQVPARERADVVGRPR